ncbi:MAG: tRNA epoxyqueuosine(34) reductase QueG, partial [Gemmatimonadota bacterium]
TSASVKAKAAELGFLACGVTSPEPVPHGEELDRWLARGYGGTMRYLHRQAARRKDPRKIVPEARSIIVVLDNYLPLLAPTDPAPRIAKYARGRDYHLELGRRLNQLEEFLREGGATLTRAYADAGPVPERELAQRAGLGWIGKNTMLIRPGTGSFFFIGSIFTDLLLEQDQPFETDRCGSCTRCLEACPTAAIVSPRILDATRCISYHTIEYRGAFSEDIERSVEGWAFGCDICNDVCPWNVSFAQASLNSAYADRGELSEAGRQVFEEMSEEEFALRFGDTPLSRPGLAGMRRNWRAAWSYRVTTPSETL